MLHLYFESIHKLVQREEFIRFPSEAFNCAWEPDWVNNPLSRQIIHDIDQVELREGVSTEMCCLLMGFRIQDLSTGTKNLLLCRYLNQLNRMTMMGENCYKYLMDIAQEKEVYMGCSNFVFFTQEDLRGRQVHFVNSDKYASTAGEFADNVRDLIHGDFFDLPSE